MSNFVSQGETNGDGSLQEVTLPVATDVTHTIQTHTEDHIPEEEELAYPNGNQPEQQQHQSTFLDSEDTPKESHNESEGQERDPTKEQINEDQNLDPMNEEDVDEDDILNAKNKSQFENLFPKEKLLNGFSVGKQWFLTAAERSQLKLKELQESETMKKVNDQITQIRESETAQNISRRTSETFESLKGSTQEYYTSVSTSMGKFNEEALRPTFTKVGESMSKLPEQVSVFHNETLKPTISKVGEGVQNAANGVIEVSKPLVRDSGEHIAKFSRNVAETTGKGINEASNWVKSKTGDNTGGGSDMSSGDNTFTNSHTV